MEYKGCVVIQGSFEDIETISELKQAFKNYQIIFSTWEGIDSSLFDYGDIILFNKLPKERGTLNFNLQKESTLNGISKAIRMGWKRVLKWRSDMIPTNADELFKLMDGELNLYMWVNSKMGYVTDYIIEGDCKDVMKLFMSSIETEKPIFPEHFVTYELFRKELVFKAKTFGFRLNNDNDIFWKKRNYYLSENKNNTELYSENIPLNWEAYPII